MNTKQLFEKTAKGYIPIYPLASMDNIVDENQSISLSEVLNKYNHIYVTFVNSKEETRLQIPEFLRHYGLWISYEEDGSLYTEFFKGSNVDAKQEDIWINDEYWELVPNMQYIDDASRRIPNGAILPEHLSDTLKQLLSEQHTIVNMVDDEDLDTDECGIIKFKDRKYNPDLASGKGYKILRKNWVNGKNVLTQEMINNVNTIYEIRYNFDLNGQEITIPEGCVLDFEGGSLSNGNIIGNNSSIVNVSNNLIFKNIEIKGVWVINNIYSNWFNFENDIYNTINFKNVCNLQNDNINNNVFFDNINININIKDREDLFKITNNTNIYFGNSIIKIIPNNNHGCNLLSILNKSNINIFNGIFIGDIKNHIFDDNSAEWNHCICIKDDCYNITINNCIIKEFVGDGIDLVDSGLELNNKNPTNIAINNCLIDNNGRQGISIESGINININNCNITNTGKIYNVKPSSGLDIEPFNKYAIVKNIIIRDSKIINNQNQYDFIIFFRKEFIYDYDLNLVIENCNIGNIYCQYRNNLKLLNSKINNFTTNNYNSIEINNTIANDILFRTGIDIKINNCNFNSIDQNDINNLLVDNCYAHQLLFTLCNNCTVQNSKFESDLNYTCKGNIKGSLNIINTEIINNNINGKIFDFLYSSTDISKLKINKSIITKSSNITEILNGNIEIYNTIIDINNAKLKCSSKIINFINNIIKGINNNVNNSFIDVPIVSSIIILNNIIKDGYTALIDGNLNNKSTLLYLGVTDIKITNYPKSLDITDIGKINIPYGVYSNKPLNPSIGYSYFCTDKQTIEGTTNGIMIYHKGDNVWVDALGREVK